MTIKLGEYTLNKVLEKIGAGGHKPGAGSAAAIQGMVSAMLIKTVVELTLGKEIYKNVWKRFKEIELDVEGNIYPRLETLMDGDSEQFDKVIMLRKERDAEINIIKKSSLAYEMLQAQILATEIPLEITKHCLKLAGYAIELFDDGFKSARGDSSVAINCAISSIGGCLSIVDLNLLSFGADDWTEEIAMEADLIKTVHSNLLLEATERQEVLNKEASDTRTLHQKLNELLADVRNITDLTSADIEAFARRMQNILWKYREQVWKHKTPEKPIKVLEAKNALKTLGYQYEMSSELGILSVEGLRFEVAGIIDSKQKYVSISDKLTPEVRNFTSAHELGHALFHPDQLLHRDMPMDGSESNITRDQREVVANKFASFFLMPTKEILRRFETQFLTTKFILNTETAIGLGLRIGELRKKCKELRDLTRLIAKVTVYRENSFESISKHFGVSVEAMAIRLEELKLVTL